MQLTVKGNHLDVGDALREHVRTHLSHTTDKYFQNAIEATVIFTKEKSKRYRVDISVHVGGGILLQSHHEAEDPYPAFDVAASRVETRLSRYKDKLRNHHRKAKPAETLASYYTFQSVDEDEAEHGTEPVIIAETPSHVPTLAVSDAVMRLELGDLPALLFRNPAHGKLNMVYRRKDSNIGWVEPIAAEEKAAATKKSVPVKKKPAAKKAPAKKTTVKKKPVKSAKKVVKVKAKAKKTPVKKKKAKR